MSPHQNFFPPRRQNSVTVLPLDSCKIISEFKKSYPALTTQDVMRSIIKVVYRSQTPSDEMSILDELYKKTSDSKSFYSNSDYHYCLKSNYSSRISRGDWCYHDIKYGHGLFSLLKIIKGYSSDWKAFLAASEILKVEISERDVSQIDSVTGERFISEAHAYEDIYPSFSLFKLPLPDEKYPFQNDNGLLSFYLLVWRSFSDPMFLFYTLQEHVKTGEKQWLFIAPPPVHMIFNRHLIEQNSYKEVHIHDDIAESHFSNTNISTGTWAGAEDLSIFSKLDWKFLKGRDVSYLFNKENQQSMQIGSDLLQMFKEIDTPLKLYPRVWPGIYIINGNEKTRVVKDPSWPEEMSIDEFYKYAKWRHNLDRRPQKKEIAPPESSDGSEDKEIEPDYIVKPLFIKDQLSLIVAKPGVGKSWVAIDLSMMIACGESIDPWLSAPKSYVTLYIDSEIYDVNVQARKRLLMANYTNKEKIQTNFQYRRIAEHRGPIDLSNEHDQKWIEESWINPLKAKFVVFDNLVGLLPDRGAQSETSWGPTVRWFGYLSTKKGITVLLVHHANSIGGVAGTNTIEANIPVILSLTDPDELDQKTIIDIRIKKGRHLSDTELDPYSVEYCTNKKKTETLRKVQPLNPPDIEEDDQPIVPAADIPQNGLTDDQQELISQLALTEHQKEIAKEMLEPASHAEFGYIKPGMFIAEGKPDRSKGTIDKIIDKLCEKEQLKTSSDFIGKYYYPDNFPKGLPIDGPGPELTSE